MRGELTIALPLLNRVPIRLGPNKAAESVIGTCFRDVDVSCILLPDMFSRMNCRLESGRLFYRRMNCCLESGRLLYNFKCDSRIPEEYIYILSLRVGRCNAQSETDWTFYARRVQRDEVKQSDLLCAASANTQTEDTRETHFELLGTSPQFCRGTIIYCSETIYIRARVLLSE